MTRWSLVALVILLGSRVASAYPHFQITSGTVRCAECHVSPAGGGLLTPWGQEEAGDTISGRGNGTFLHGAVELPSWLAIGGDLRTAALANNVGADDGTELAVFPMQADLAVRITSGTLSFGGTIGLRGAVRRGAPSSPSSTASDVDGPSTLSYLISREHYAMWRSEDAYVRAGRFAAPYGLRIADHTAYVRRYLGSNLAEETYGIGGGILRDSWELHATGFVHDPLQGATRKEVGGAVLFETQRDSLVVGASARAGIGSADTRLQVGPHVKLWLDGSKLLLQGEVHGVRQLFDGPGDRWQLAAYAGPVLIPMQGLYVGAAYQVFAEDLQVRAVTRHAGDAWVSYLPYAHVELILSGRAQWIGPGEHAYVGMLQVHYSL